MVIGAGLTGPFWGGGCEVVAPAVGVWLVVMVGAIISNRNGKVRLLDQRARETSTWIIGQPGVGKSKLIEYLALQDARAVLLWARGAVQRDARRGLCVIDIHGDLFRNLVRHLAGMLPAYPELAERVVIIDPCHPVWTVGINPLATVEGISPERMAYFVTDIVVKIWRLDTASAPRMVRLLANLFLALQDLNLSLLDAARFLLDADWRESLVPRMTNESARAYFMWELPRGEATLRQWVTPVLNRIGPLIFDPELKLMLAGRSELNFRQVMDRSLIVLVHLPKGLIGEGSSALLAAWLVALVQKAALARADSRDRPRYTLYLDEFHAYTSDNIVDILSESRKYGLTLCLSHQFVKQLDPAILHACMNTVGTQIAFRVGYHDAAYLAKDVFPARDFITRREREVSFNPRTLIEVKNQEKPLGWDGLAHILAHLEPREFVFKRRGPYRPVKQRTRDLPDPVPTPALEALVEELYAASGERFGRRKSELRQDLEAEPVPASDAPELEPTVPLDGPAAPDFWENIVVHRRGTS